MKIQKFEDLPVWKESICLTKEIYILTSKGKFSKDFGLRDQIRRAVVSISSNIVEGFEKSNNNELIRFLRISKGSTGEVRNQLFIALEIEYLTKNEFDEMNIKFDSLGKQIGSFVCYLEKQRKNGNFINK